MSHTIEIVKGIHSYDKSAYYEAYCNRCHEYIVGMDRLRNRVWSTKSVAVKHAQAHAAMHARVDSRTHQWGSGKSVVATISVNCESEESAHDIS